MLANKKRSGCRPGFLFLAISAFATGSSAEAADLPEVVGLHDACVAGTLLAANHIRHEVIEVGSQAGCIYDLDGVRYIYTPSGSARLNPAKLARVTIRKVSDADASQIADGDDDIQNGCLVFAACAFAQCRTHPEVVWAGIVTAELINTQGDGEGSVKVTGHALTAFEDADRQVFIQENGGSPKRVRQLTRLAQQGDRSWYDPSMLLLYSEQGALGTADFAGQCGQVR